MSQQARTRATVSDCRACRRWRILVGRLAVMSYFTLDADAVIGDPYGDSLLVRFQLDAEHEVAMKIATSSMPAGVANRLQRGSQQHVGYDGWQLVGCRAGFGYRLPFHF